MHRIKKIKIHLTKDQLQIVEKTFGVLRFIYNKFVEANIDYHYETGQFIFAYEFGNFMRQVLPKEYQWINDVDSKSKEGIFQDAERGLRKYLKKQNGFLKFKSKKDPVQSMHFVKDGIRFTKDLSHVNIPILHEIKLCEKGYLLPEDIPYISSGRILKDGEDYFVLFWIKCEYGFREEVNKPYSDGMGIDVGIRKYATIYHDGQCVTIPHFDELPKVKWLESKIKYLQRIISYKELINLKKLGYEHAKDVRKEDKQVVFHSGKIEKLRKRARKCQKKLYNIRIHLLYRICNTLVRTKPKFITVEHLNIQGILRKGHSSRALSDKMQKSMFYTFKMILLAKCEEYKITLREAETDFPSTLICSNCGFKKNSLSSRVFKCKHCGLKIDRDENAAINLYNLKSYKILDCRDLP